jgi:hypothetical protein
VIDQVGSAGKVETMARLEGRNMTMVLAPEKKAVVKKPHESRAAHDEDDAEEAEPQQAPAEPVTEAVVETADPA